MRLLNHRAVFRSSHFISTTTSSIISVYPPFVPLKLSFFFCDGGVGCAVLAFGQPLFVPHSLPISEDMASELAQDFVAEKLDIVIIGDQFLFIIPISIIFAQNRRYRRSNGMQLING